MILSLVFFTLCDFFLFYASGGIKREMKNTNKMYLCILREKTYFHSRNAPNRSSFEQSK